MQRVKNSIVISFVKNWWVQSKSIIHITLSFLRNLTIIFLAHIFQRISRWIKYPFWRSIGNFGIFRRWQRWGRTCSLAARVGLLLKNVERRSLFAVPFGKVRLFLYRLIDDYLSLLLIRQILFRLHDFLDFFQNIIAFYLFLDFLISTYILFDFLTLRVLESLKLIVAIVLIRVIIVDDHFNFGI